MKQINKSLLKIQLVLFLDGLANNYMSNYDLRSIEHCSLKKKSTALTGMAIYKILKLVLLLKD